MNRLFTTTVYAGQGGVYRTLPEGDCLTVAPPFTYAPPDCEVYPSTAEHIGSLPDSFGGAIDLDASPWEEAWEDILIGGLVYDRTYPNLWRRLSDNPNTGGAATPRLQALRQEILDNYTDCYCSGIGIDYPRLRLGVPTFPAIDTVPYFWFPTVDVAPPLLASVRTANPNGEKLACDASESPGITMEVVNGQLQVQYSPEEVPRLDSGDRSASQSTGNTIARGYPKWCYTDDPDNPGKHRLLYREFPTWDGAGGADPLGYIPFVADVGCTTNGELAVHYGGLVFHNGKLHEVLWDTDDPRESPGDNHDTAPTAPSDLTYNEDYQGTELVAPAVEEPCEEDCN